jgi:hypothetical protein
MTEDLSKQLKDLIKQSLVYDNEANLPTKLKGMN